MCTAAICKCLSAGYCALKTLTPSSAYIYPDCQQLRRYIVRPTEGSRVTAAIKGRKSTAGRGRFVFIRADPERHDGVQNIRDTCGQQGQGCGRGDDTQISMAAGVSDYVRRGRFGGTQRSRVRQVSSSHRSVKTRSARGELSFRKCESATGNRDL